MKLTITEYNNYGDVSVGLHVEPARIVQEVAFGEISAPLHKDTRATALFADMPCKVQFVPDGAEVDEKMAFPMAEEYEIDRAVHMSGTIRVAVWARD